METNEPLLSIIIPTRNRPHLLPRAVESALSQTVTDVEVIVVDDASNPPVQLPIVDPRLRLIRQPQNRGLAAALNTGAKAARGRWIAHLDDDDRLLPTMAEISLDALTQSTLPPPVVVLSGIEIVSPDSTVRSRLLPPTRPRGNHYSLEPLEPGHAYETRNTFVVERSLLASVGYWDENLRSSIRHELFLRLNPICSILGLPEITYQRFEHDGARVHLNHAGKYESFAYIERKHQALFEAHPQRYAHYLRSNANRLFALGRWREALARLALSLRLAPFYTVAYIRKLAMKQLMRSIRQPHRVSS